MALSLSLSTSNSLDPAYWKKRSNELEVERDKLKAKIKAQKEVIAERDAEIDNVKKKLTLKKDELDGVKAKLKLLSKGKKV